MAEIEINGRTFRCDPLPATKGLELAGRFAKTLAPVLPILAAATSDKIGDKGLGLSDISLEAGMLQAVADAVLSYDITGAIKLSSDLARLCKVDGEPVIVDGNLQDMGELLEVAMWAASVQLSPFSRGGALARAGAHLMTVMPKVDETEA